MELLERIPVSDAVQAHFSMVIAFIVIEKDILTQLNALRPHPVTTQRLKDVDFMIDELAIRVLERETPYEC